MLAVFEIAAEFIGLDRGLVGRNAGRNGHNVVLDDLVGSCGFAGTARLRPGGYGEAFIIAHSGWRSIDGSAAGQALRVDEGEDGDGGENQKGGGGEHAEISLVVEVEVVGLGFL